VLLATRIKQAYDKQAREKQNTAEAELKHAAPLEIVPDGLDMSQSSDLTVLGNVRDEARDRQQSLTAAREVGQQTEREVSQAKERIERVKAEYTGLTANDARQSLEKAESVAAKADEEVQAISARLAQAKERASAARFEVKVAEGKVDTALQHDAAVSTLAEVTSRKVSYPSAEEIAQATTTVAAATQAYEQGIRIHDAKINHEKAKRHREAAEEAEKEASEAKNKAGQVFDILAQSLHTTHLHIKSVDGNPRLFVDHPKRGRTVFDRVNGLSDGERVDFTLRELLPHIGSPGLLPIPQRVWQDLQPTDRQNLHSLAAEKGLYVFGAQVTDETLHVVYLGGEPEKP